MKPSLPFHVEHTHRNVATVRCRATKGRKHFRFLLRTDAHHDNPHCNQEMEKRHLDEALETGAGIIDNGDLFCAMQGKYDRRSDKSCLRPEHQGGDYLDSLVRTAADFYEPYAHHWITFGRGNHEQSIRNKHETDLTERLAATLADRTGATLRAGGYTGWVRFMFERHTKVYRRTLWHGHGWGGGGPVTMGTIQAANRMPMMLDGCDILFTGHVHEALTAEKNRMGLDHNGKPYNRPMKIVLGPTYKDEYGDGYSGWHVETGKPPKPLGAWWLEFEFTSSDGVFAEVRRAE